MGGSQSAIKNNHQSNKKANYVNSYTSWIENQYFGLYNLDKTITLPLKNMKVFAHVSHEIIRYQYEFSFVNPIHNYVEGIFYFQVPLGRFFKNFKVKYGVSSEIKGSIRHKDDNIAYINKIEIDETITPLDFKKFERTIYKVDIPGIAPQESINISYSIIEPLNIGAHKFWKISFQYALTPPFSHEHSQNHIPLTYADYPIIEELEIQDIFPCNVSIFISCPKPITFLKSPTHKIIVNFTESSTKCTLTLDSDFNYKPDKDFEVYYSYDTWNHPLTYETKFFNYSCAMIRILPNFRPITNKEAYNDLFEGFDDYGTLVKENISEFLFILNTENLNKILLQRAKNMIIIALKSIPHHSKFSLIILNDCICTLSKSLVANDSNIDIAIEKINNYESEYFNNKLCENLIEILQNSEVHEHWTNVILITSGETDDLGNRNQFIECVKAHTNHIKIFSFIIEHGNFNYMANDISYYTRGLNVIAKKTYHHDRFIGKFIKLFHDSLYPSMSQFAFEIDDEDKIDFILPNPKHQLTKLPNEDATFFIFFKPTDLCSQQLRILITFYNSYLKTIEKAVINVDIGKFKVIDEVIYIAIENSLYEIERAERDEIYEILEDSKDKIYHAALAYQKSFSKTAFVCDLQYLDEEQDGPINLIFCPNLIQTASDIELPATKKLISDHLSNNKNDDINLLAASSDNEIRIDDIETNINMNDDYKLPDVLLMIIKLFKLEGYWEFSEQIMVLMKIDSAKFRKSVPNKLIINKNQNLKSRQPELANQENQQLNKIESIQSIQSIPNIPNIVNLEDHNKKNESYSEIDAWLTIAILVSLEKYFGDYCDCWLIINEKAQTWLKLNKIIFKNHIKSINHLIIKL